MTSKEIRKIKYESSSELPENILDMVTYIENIESSELNNKIMSFTKFQEERRKNPGSKFVEGFIIE